MIGSLSHTLRYIILTWQYQLHKRKGKGTVVYLSIIGVSRASEIPLDMVRLHVYGVLTQIVYYPGIDHMRSSNATPFAQR
jgi:hypothetical protein